MKDNIKRILREDVISITKLSVFDFDGTTVDTGTPEEKAPKPGIQQYEIVKWDTLPDEQKKELLKLRRGTKLDEKEKGRLKELESLIKWPHVGWWGRKESLDMSVFNFKAKPNVKSDWQKEWSDPNTLVISLTGRRPKLSAEVEVILDANGYKFDEYLYNYGSDTVSNKLEQMGKILSDIPSIKTISLWDDRVEHISTFKRWGDNLVDNGRLESFNLVHVK